MEVYSFAPLGFDGRLVSVEVDIRPGIPGIDIVGLAGSAVREARERIRVAVRNSGQDFPRGHVLINLSPADLPKSGASYDLPIAVAILAAAGTFSGGDPPGISNESTDERLLILGELRLSGEIRPVPGVLPAVAEALAKGIGTCIVPRDTLGEAVALAPPILYGGSFLADVMHFLLRRNDGSVCAWADHRVVERPPERDGDYAEIQGQEGLKRAFAVAAAGRHNIFVFGPPGCGKTMASLRMPTILPPLAREEALEATRIHSIAGMLPDGRGLLAERPFRSPHHSASVEGLIGGRDFAPGEVSLAHGGVLFLDEAPEFKKPVLQSLRQPLESRRVSIVRVGLRYWYPADFQLVMTANPCPCANLGRDDRVCLCSQIELDRYWKRLGAALLDRIDIRFPVRPGTGVTEAVDGPSGLGSKEMRSLVYHAADIQAARFAAEPTRWNSRMNPTELALHCRLEGPAASAFSNAVHGLGLSQRAVASVLKVARTIADLEGEITINKYHVLEAAQYRRYGEGDYFWSI